ncbi:MAG TPA: sulfate ABC transporter substrate-binding protein [Candidatus Manganitrophaceae bacterium]|nr:sulfate ABC transporter substrate-binding protein [Candidatus Manganitrophaceae bacterium]
MVGYIAPLFRPGLAGDAPTIVIYGFSILEEAVNEGIVPAFQKRWREQTGGEVRFYTSFAGSGTVMNQIRFGAPADIAIFSHTLDAYRLQEAGLIRTDWNRFPHRGILNRTPIVFIVRKGNPKGIGRFQDLRRPGIGIVHPDPQTSGGALWSILAEYGAFALDENAASPKRTDAGEGERGLAELWKNVIVLASSSRASRTQFEMGFGDVLITYEQEAVKDMARGRFKHELVLPKETIYAEHQVALIDGNIAPKERKVVEAFLDFLWTEEAQRIFVEYGFRSISDDAINRQNPFFREIPSSFTVDALGGWKAAYAEIVEKVWKKQVLEEAHG